jgi:hypothetical protein
MNRLNFRTPALVAFLAIPLLLMRASNAQCQHWHPLSASQALNNDVHDVIGFDDGSGPAIFAVGDFSAGGSTALNRIGRWNGQTWSPLAGGFTRGMFSSAGISLAVFDDGHGAALYASGAFDAAGGVPANNIAKWNGTSWSSVGGGLSYYAYQLRVLDDGTGPALYAVGDFMSPVAQVGKFDGTSWSQVGNGLPNTPFSITVFDDGTGPHIYAGTNQIFSGGSGVFELVSNQWVGLGTIPGASVYALAVYDDGSGPALYAGGFYDHIGSVPANAIAKWNGTSFAPLGTGITGVQASVQAMTVFDDGAGPALYVGGNFDFAGGVSATNVARWNGTAWSALGSGVTGNPMHGYVSGMNVYDDGSAGGADLFVGGNFTLADGQPAAELARWTGCTSPRAFCSGDGSGTPCPCSNSGSAGHGCANSASLAGASLTTTGSTSLANDTLVLTSASMPTTTSVLFFQGTLAAGNGQGVAFYDGLLCASGSIVRLGSKIAVGGAASFPQAGDPAVHLRGMVTMPGVRNYQAWYRNSLGPCGSGANTTNGISVLWVP